MMDCIDTHNENQVILKNNGFKELHKEFCNKEWELVRNSFSLLIYKKEKKYIYIFFKSDHIEISLPISSIQYRTTCKNYF